MQRTLALVIALAAAPVWAQYGPTPAPKDTTCPTNDMTADGHGKDGFPSLTNPKVVSVDEGNGFLSSSALVLGVVVNGEARAYPHNVLWYHEIVNDVLGGKPIVVTYSPLTGSGIVFSADVGGSSLSFGSSGEVIDSNLVAYDRTTESFWSQMNRRASCGKLVGKSLTMLPVVDATWAAWRSLHPDTSVVSFDTGFSRNYNQYPYGSYDQVGNTQLLYPQSFIDSRLPEKQPVLGLVEGSLARAYPYSKLGSRAAINDVVNGIPVLVVFDAASKMALPFDRRVQGQTLTFDAQSSGFPFELRDRETQTVWDLTGRAVSGPLSASSLKPLATYSAMWFAWASFYRGTDVYGTSAAGPDVVITIQGMEGGRSFSPASASLKVGQTVAWRNADSIAHTASADNGSFDTGIVAPGATSAPVKLTSAGTFAYHCNIHPSMIGSINVTQ